jgi:putative spermidine/putrescine transport system ATP-binding protein
MNNRAYIRIEDVFKTYPDGTEALQPIRLEVQEGEVLVLLGPSGCGKSTLLRLIAGLENPSGGRIHVGGADITDLPPEKRGFGLVFQQYALFPTMTVEENIGFGLKVRKKPKQEIIRKVNEMIELVNLEQWRKRYPSQLSGGQQQRVAVARALAIEPNLLLMDEPLTALDAQLKEHLRIELAQLFRRLKITTIYVTHDQIEAMAIADRIAVMNKGKIEQIGKPEEIYHHPASAFVAQFVGQVNRLEGIARKRDDGFRVNVGFHELRYTGEQPLTDGDLMTVFVRPEDISIADGPDSFAATVSEVIFLGDRFRVIADTGTQRLLMDVPNDVLLQNGKMISLNISENKLIFTKESAGRNTP